jgi:hypothetical protein
MINDHLQRQMPDGLGPNRALIGVDFVRYGHESVLTPALSDHRCGLRDVQMGRLRRGISSLRGVLPAPIWRRFRQATPRGLLREICNWCRCIRRRRNAILDRWDHVLHVSPQGTVEVRTRTRARTKSTLTMTDLWSPLLDAGLFSAASLTEAEWTDRNSGRQCPYCCSA